MTKLRRVITDRPIRVGVVGCGRISANHFGAIEAHKQNLQLVAVCDTDAQQLRATERKYNVTGYGNLTEMLASCDMDVVALCTPSGLHPAQAIEVARAKRHVMTEKPMATR